MKHPSPRYVSTVARNLAELQRAIHNRDAMLAIEAERNKGVKSGTKQVQQRGQVFQYSIAS